MKGVVWSVEKKSYRYKQAGMVDVVYECASVDQVVDWLNGAGLRIVMMDDSQPREIKEWLIKYENDWLMWAYQPGTYQLKRGEFSRPIYFVRATEIDG